ncbi:hypothetical protein BC629DRAFT_1737155 [Irpex lacteus]|nr:hypothetical protein BC629DRAFT_1737155 [Irpex lacteus]
MRRPPSRSKVAAPRPSLGPIHQPIPGSLKREASNYGFPMPLYYQGHRLEMHSSSFFAIPHSKRVSTPRHLSHHSTFANLDLAGLSDCSDRGSFLPHKSSGSHPRCTSTNILQTPPGYQEAVRIKVPELIAREKTKIGWPLTTSLSSDYALTTPVDLQEPLTAPTTELLTSMVINEPRTPPPYYDAYGV